MSNIPVAFVVLATFFFVYFVAALWRSRPAGSPLRRDRNSWHMLVGRIRRAVHWGE
jgi:hypothetical protein